MIFIQQQVTPFNESKNSVFENAITADACWIAASSKKENMTTKSENKEDQRY